MFGDVPAIRRAQPELARIGAQFLCHHDDGVHDVVVSRAAEIRQPAGDRESPRIVFRDADFLAAKFDGGGKARIQVDKRHIANVEIGHGQRLLAHHVDGRRGMEIHPFGHVPDVGSLGTAVQNRTHLDWGMPSSRAFCHAHHHDRGGHIHLDHGIEIFGVGKAYEAVLIGWCGDFFGRAIGGKPRIRIFRCDLGERRKEFPEPLKMFRR